MRRVQYSVQAMCRGLKISESGYYSWLKRAHNPQPGQLRLVQILRIYDLHPDNGNYSVRHYG